MRDGVPLKQAADVNEVWCNLVDEVTKPVNDANNLFNQGVLDNLASKRFNTEDIKAFSTVLTENYATEEPFEEGLFMALKTCFARRNLIRKEISVNILEKEDGDGNNAENLEPIVFHYGIPGEDTDGLMYAIGIARQSTGQRRASDGSDDHSSELAANCKRHHGSCLLKRETRSDQWTKVKCFSDVELKVGKENDGFVVSVEDDEVDSFDITSGKGAISQALMYTFEWMLPSHAEVGELQDLPWAAIVGKWGDGKTNLDTVSEDERKAEADAGNTIMQKSESGKTTEAKAKKTGNTSANKHYRWVAGEIFVPEKCGGMFEYGVTKCGSLEDNEDHRSVKKVISVYLETLLFGIRAAKKMLDAIKSEDGIKSKDEIQSKDDIESQDDINSEDDFKLYPISGKKLKFGEVVLEGMKLRGKPQIGMRLLKRGRDDGHWSTSQGEIFTGTLNFHQLVKKLSRKTATPSILLFKEDDENVRVVVKVASTAVHKYLNHPSEAWRAMKIISERANSKYEDKNKNLEANTALETTKKWDLFNVLFAAEKVGKNTLITTMADLSSDYEDLIPRNHAVTTLWAAFEDLVIRVLLPLADMNVIHPDIRPGWDFTANILYIKDGQGDCDKPAMQMIDFDSLVVHSDWSYPNTGSFKYIGRNANSYTFLWWQCVAVAYAWSRQVDQEDMGEINLTIQLRRQWPSLLPEAICVRAGVTQMGKLELDASLKELSTMFNVQEDNRF
jgi:hypothetical protein